MTTAVTAIGYVRRSTNRQEESLEQQREKLAAFAASKGWTLGRIYEDDAISGSDMQRPGLESLLAHVESDTTVGVVLAWERNRLARPKDPVDGLLLERRLIKAGKRVCYVATGQEADRSFTSGLVGFVEHYQNGDYLRKLSRDSMRGMVARAQRGLWPAAVIPFGYDRLCVGMDGTPKRIIRDMSDRSQLILHPETREVLEHIRDGHRYQKPEHEAVTLVLSEPARVEAVRKLFEDYLAGLPFRLLRDKINATGMRTVYGGIFTIPTLHTILRNPAYRGTLVFNRSTNSKWHRYTGGKSVERQDEGEEKRSKEDWIVAENAWPALVDAELFEKVQNRLREMQKAKTFATGRSIKTRFILSGTLCCGVCGGKLIGQTTRGKTRTGTMRLYRRYVCGTHHKGQHGHCPTRYGIPAEVVENQVLGIIKEDLIQLKGDQQLHRYVAEEMAKACGHRDDSRKRLKAQLAELEAQGSKLATHLGMLDVQTASMLGLYAKAKAIAEERQQVEAQLKAVQSEIPELPEASEIARRADEELAQLDALIASGSLEEQRELIRQYVKAAKTDPARQEIELSFVPALFSRIATGALP